MPHERPRPAPAAHSARHLAPPGADPHRHPRPDCRNCDGIGGIEHDYGNHYDGEYEGTDWEPCPCWNEHRRWTLLPLPRLPKWLRRCRTVRDPWAANGYSDEPPF